MWFLLLTLFFLWIVVGRILNDSFYDDDISFKTKEETLKSVAKIIFFPIWLPIKFGKWWINLKEKFETQ